MFMVLTTNMFTLSRACKSRLLKPLRTDNLETKAVSILGSWLLGSQAGVRLEKADERVDIDNEDRIEKVDPGVVAGDFTLLL